jgi:hypothetical protein
MDKCQHLANDTSDQSIVRTLQVQTQAQSAKSEGSCWPVNRAAERELESRAWEAINKARDVLRLPAPDTFLGRQHYDFISPPDENKE